MVLSNPEQMSVLLYHLTTLIFAQTAALETFWIRCLLIKEEFFSTHPLLCIFQCVEPAGAVAGEAWGPLCDCSSSSRDEIRKSYALSACLCKFLLPEGTSGRHIHMSECLFSVSPSSLTPTQVMKCLCAGWTAVSVQSASAAAAAYHSFSSCRTTNEENPAGVLGFRVCSGSFWVQLYSELQLHHLLSVAVIDASVTSVVSGTG